MFFPFLSFCSRNNLTFIPEILCKLPLEILLISHNRLKCLPADMDKMTALKELDVSVNEITHLPTQLTKVATLRRLDVRCNQLSVFPAGSHFLSINHRWTCYPRYALARLIDWSKEKSLTLRHVSFFVRSIDSFEWFIYPVTIGEFSSALCKLDSLVKTEDRRETG